MKSDLDLGKLTSVDENGDRIYLIPAEVRGFFRRHRDWTQLVLLVIFLGLPWIQIGSYQSIFLNVSKREFAFFGVLFKAHEAPLLFFLFASAALGLAFVTSIWGRIWCGWACPQTVFIDGVYRRIEKFVEGNYIERRKLRQAPLSIKKMTKKVIKWFLFFVFSSLAAHSFMAYFVGSKELVQMMENPPAENWTYFLIVSFFTAVTLFDFAWFREQFCVVMCPYGRFQGVLLEPTSLAVSYDFVRGEPRRGKTLAFAKSGDCVSCNRCVEVCPTGIDIRNGLQMECINCTACIDACDEIMGKVKKPKGLIAYRTLNGQAKKFFSFKTVSYFFLLSLCLGGLIYSLLTRAAIDVAVLRAGGLPYTVMTNERGESYYLNHFKLHLHNQSAVAAKYRLQVPAEWAQKGIVLVVSQNPVSIAANAETTLHFFVQVPPALINSLGQFKTQIDLINELDSKSVPLFRNLILLGPRT